MTATIWEPGEETVVDAQNTIKHEVIVATAGQEVLTLTQFQYTLGAGSIILYKDGSVLIPVDDYQELTSTTIRLTQDATAGQVYLVIGFVAIYDIDDALAAAGKIYLGIKATDPTTDNQGDPLLVGAIYINSTTGGRVWTGTAWTPMGVPLTDVLAASQNLNDLANKQLARQNLGVQQYTTDVTFTGQRSKTVTVANAAATVGAKVLGSVIAVAGQYRQDELEFEAFSVTGYVKTAGQVVLNVQSLWGRLSGTYTVNYTIQP